VEAADSGESYFHFAVQKVSNQRFALHNDSSFSLSLTRRVFRFCRQIFHISCRILGTSLKSGPTWHGLFFTIPFSQVELLTFYILPILYSFSVTLWVTVKARVSVTAIVRVTVGIV